MGRSFEKLNEGVALDIHRPGKDSVAILDFFSEMLRREPPDIQINQFKFPFILWHQGREGQQPKGRERSFAPDVLHHILKAPEGISREFRRNQQSLFHTHGITPSLPPVMRKEIFILVRLHN